MTLESLDAATALRACVGVSTSGCHKLPHLDCLIQGTGYEVLPVWCECDRVDRVLVAVGTLEAFDEVASCGIPDTNALVERTRSDKLGVGGDGNRGDTIFNTESKDVLAGLNVPETNSAIPTARSDGAAITSKVERVDVLVVTSKCISNASGRDIPYLCIVSLINNIEMVDLLESACPRHQWQGIFHLD